MSNCPDAPFYIWLKVPDGDDLAFAKTLWQKPPSVPPRPLPRPRYRMGAIQAKATSGIALVADVDSCVKAAETIVSLYR